jgi:hypothetical protein
MNIKDQLLSQQWLIGLSTAVFVFAGFSIGSGESFIGIGLGVLGTGLLAMQYNIGKRERSEAYGAGLNHHKRRPSNR